MPLPEDFRSLNKSALVALALSKYDTDITGGKAEMIEKLEELAVEADQATAAEVEPDDTDQPLEITVEGPTIADTMTPAEKEKDPDVPIHLLTMEGSPEHHPSNTTHLYNPATKMSHPASPATLKRMDLRPITYQEHCDLMKYYGLKHGTTSRTAPKLRQ